MRPRPHQLPAPKRYARVRRRPRFNLLSANSVLTQQERGRDNANKKQVHHQRQMRTKNKRLRPLHRLRLSNGSAIHPSESVLTTNDLSKMVNSKGVFFVEDGEEVDEDSRMKERERERQRAKQNLEPRMPYFARSLSLTFGLGDSGTTAIYLDPNMNP